MGKLKVGRMLDCLCLSCSSSTCFCMNGLEGEDSMERKALIGSDGVEMMRIKDVIGETGNQTLAYQLKPKVSISSPSLFPWFRLVFCLLGYLKVQANIIDFCEKNEGKTKQKGILILINHTNSISNTNHSLCPSMTEPLATHSSEYLYVLNGGYLSWNLDCWYFLNCLSERHQTNSQDHWLVWSFGALSFTLGPQSWRPDKVHLCWLWTDLLMMITNN